VCTLFVRFEPVDCCTCVSSALLTSPRPADSAAGVVAGARHNGLTPPLILNRIQIVTTSCILPWVLSQYTVSRMRSEAHGWERGSSRARVRSPRDSKCFSHMSERRQGLLLPVFITSTLLADLEYKMELFSAVEFERFRPEPDNRRRFGSSLCLQSTNKADICSLAISWSHLFCVNDWCSSVYCLPALLAFG
jgi:hypothetical protein